MKNVAQWISKTTATQTVITSLLCLVNKGTKQFHNEEEVRVQSHFGTHNISLKWRSKLFSHFLITHIPFNFINLLRVQLEPCYFVLKPFIPVSQGFKFKTAFVSPCSETLTTTIYTKSTQRAYVSCKKFN